ncbi:MAG: adenylate/guanylate cyclase domain-containing protein [Acidimicrobiales bacterium]
MSDQLEPSGRPRTMHELVLALGLPEGDVERAAADGTLGLLAIATFIFPGESLYTQAEAMEHSGVGPDTARYWRALGFPDPRSDEKAFTQADIDLLRVVKQLVDVGLVERDVALQMARVIGASMARIAAAQVDAIEARVDAEGADTMWSARIADTDPAVLRAGMLQTTMPQILESAWRRHMQVAARRRMVRDAGVGGGSANMAVGFADLVGFTALSQQIDDHALAAVVERFEQTAYDVVNGRGGRVVKMIGDEVLFAVQDPAVAVEIGLALAAAYHDDDVLSDVRVGIACGPVLEREGDVFGPTVNLASRIVNIAYEGSVVVSAAVQEALADEPGLQWKHLRTRHLKDVGRVHLWAARASDDGFEVEGGEERARHRRGAIRDRVSDLIEDQ